MLINNSIVVAVSFLIQIHCSAGFCKSYDQKSSVAEEVSYLDDYGEETCCEMSYPTIYHYIKCINSTLTTGQQLEVNDNENTNFKYIKFEYSKVPLLPVGVFTAFTSISQLFLNNSGVENVHPGAFTDLTNLEDLYLQDNNIRNISTGSLNSLRSLKLLDLSNNRLEMIEEQAFLGLFNLENIALHHNRLKNLIGRTFQNLNNLKYMDLSNNHLLEISPKLLLNLTNLYELNLSSNNLTDFDFFFLPDTLKKLLLSGNQINSLENWSGLSKLQEINLSNNRLTKITTVNANLKYLNLSYNKMFEINFLLFNEVPELITLDLSDNVISNLSQDTFTGSCNLKKLFLQNNRLVNIPVGSFRNLKVLSLLNFSSNQIVEFEFGTFSGLTALETLDMSDNKLSYLYESSLHTLKNLKYLNINDNFITSFDPFDLLQHTTSLKNISIDNNPWNCKSLLKIIKLFIKMNVTVSEGTTEKSENIKGIPCINSNFNKSSSFVNFHFSNETLIRLLQNISQDVKELKSISKNSVDKNYSSNISEELNFLQDYFNNGFKNSTFYNFFTDNPFYQNSSSLKDVRIKSAFYTNNNAASNNEGIILSKTSEIQNGIIIVDNKLMITVVVILAFIMILLIFSNVKTCFSNKNCKGVSLRNEKKPNDAVELI